MLLNLLQSIRLVSINLSLIHFICFSIVPRPAVELFAVGPGTVNLGRVVLASSTEGIFEASSPIALDKRTRTIFFTRDNTIFKSSLTPGGVNEPVREY